jgi:rRNA-processing protein EBP2
MAKSSSKRRKDKTEISPKDEKRQRIVTMQALQELSSDEDDDGALPPESEWSKEALALKAAIEAGTFDAAVTKKDDDEGAPFEEVDLDDDDEDEEDEDEREDDVDSESLEDDKQNVAENDSETDNKEKESEDDDSEIDGDENDEDDEDTEEVTPGGDNTGEVDPGVGVGKDDSDEDDEEEGDSDNEDEDESPNRSSEHQITQGKALHIVAASLAAEKKDWPWAETFDIIPPTPLPFSDKNGEGGTNLGVHDDLQREVAFYDLALEAVLEAKRRCHSAGIPFTRPDDFFAEMVKTDGMSYLLYMDIDIHAYLQISHCRLLFSFIFFIKLVDHMARVKDRLIFESKKIEAVAQRKSNKEQKLRAKETQAHKLAEKAKKKRDHFQEVASYAESAKNQDTAIKSKKRAYADQKYGHGGKRGRFKQNDAQSMNDMSGFNKKQGTFTKKPKTVTKNGAGANRKGKRARDASRSR